MESAAPERIGRYEVLSVLGQGGMGVVYKARDPLIDRIVAVKTIGTIDNEDDQLVQRLQMEARSAGRLHHPNIVTIFDFGREGETWYLAMEYVEGANLAHVIDEGEPLNLFTRLDIVVKLADALDYAHGLGVVHRDIKPSNICLTERADPKVLDFGLARFDETRLTRSGMTSGTIAYMSPERIRGESTPADDVFALGAVAYELFTGQRAFPGRSYSDIATKILSGKYPAPAAGISDCPPEIGAVIERTLAARREDRLSLARDLGAALRSLRDSAEFQQRYASGSGSSGPLAGLATGMRSQNPYSAPEMERMSATGAAQAASSELPRTEMMETPDLVSASSEFPDLPTTAFPRPAMRDDEVLAPTVTAPAYRPERPDDEPLDPTVAVRASPRDDGTDPTVAVHAMRDEDGTDPTVMAPRMPAAAAESPLAPTVTATVLSRGRQIIQGNVADTKAVSARRDIAFYILTAATAALTFAAFVSLPAVSGTVFYILAIVSWLVLLRWSRGARLGDILIAGAVTRALTLLIPAPLPLNDDTTAPLVDLITSPFGGGMTEAMLWRVLLICGELAAAAMLWKVHAPRIALALAMCPLLVVFGSGMAQAESLAASLLVAALYCIETRRDSSAVIVASAAAGLSIFALAALPLIVMLTWSLWGMVLVTAIVIAIPVLLDGVESWLRPISAVVNGSTLLQSGSDLLVRELTERDAGESTRRWLTAIFGSGEAEEEVSNSGLAAAMAGAIAVIVATLFARRNRDAAAGLATILGIVLVLSAPAATGPWLLLAGMAIASWSAGWLTLALASPVLAMVKPENQALALGIIVVIAIAAAVALREKKQAPAAERAPSPAH